MLKKIFSQLAVAISSNLNMQLKLIKTGMAIKLTSKMNFTT